MIATNDPANIRLVIPELCQMTMPEVNDRLLVERDALMARGADSTILDLIPERITDDDLARLQIELRCRVRGDTGNGIAVYLIGIGATLALLGIAGWLGRRSAR